MPNFDRASARASALVRRRQKTLPTAADLPMTEFEIEGYAATWGVLCNGKSLIAEGAFRQLIASGTWRPEMLWHHESGAIAGRWTDFEEDDRGLLVRGVLDLSKPFGCIAYDRISTRAAVGLSTKDISLQKPISPTVVQVDRVVPALMTAWLLNRMVQ